MMLPKSLALLILIAAVCEANRLIRHQKRNVPAMLCGQGYNSSIKIQCFCIQDGKEIASVISAECHLSAAADEDDHDWQAFQQLRHANRVVFSTARNLALEYVPTKAITHLNQIQILEIKYGKIDEIKPFAFGNVTAVEISLSNNKIRKLDTNSFSGMKYLRTVNLDKNQITEINRNVFVDLPSLSKLYLTSNKITTVHDAAFVHLANLQKLELDNNRIFSLNSETFFGLKNLQTLELSSNSLELIGDDTFSSLGNLKHLNLNGNKIQILDPQAFRGLAKLQRLSLALNRLSVLDKESLFEGLAGLSFLSLRDNKLRQLKSTVMAPIITNFYGATSKFEFQGNEFTCDCDLDWFLLLGNRTENESLKLEIENLNCHPDAEISEAWKNLKESDNNNGENLEDSSLSQNQNGDYEYYDESQLNGKLFYTDVKDLLKCSKSTQSDNVEELISTGSTSETPPTEAMEEKHQSSPVVASTTPSTATAQGPKSKTVIPYQSTIIKNRGVLDLTDDEPKTLLLPDKKNTTLEMDKLVNKHFTIKRVITVSARPDKPQRKIYEEEREMAADQAVADIVKGQPSEHAKLSNNGTCCYSCRGLFVIVIVVDVIIRYVYAFM